MGLLRDLIERKHSDARDQAFRQHDAYKTIITDTRKPEEGGFSDEYKQEKLDEWLNLASPSKQHAKAVSPVFRHLLGLAGMIGGGGNDQPLQGSAPGTEAMGPPQAQPLAVDSTGAATQAPAAPTTTGSVMGDTPSAMATPAGNAGPVAAKPSGADPSSIYNSVPGVSAPVGPPGTEGTASVSPRVLTGDVSPEEEELASRSSFRGGQPTPGQAGGVSDVGSTPKPAPQAPAVPERKAQPISPTGNQPVLIKGQPKTAPFMSFEQQMERTRKIAEYNIKIKGEGMELLQPYEQRVQVKQLEFQLQQMADLVKKGMDPQLAAARVGLKPLAGENTPIPGSAYVERDNPETGLKETGYNTQGGRFVKAQGRPIEKPVAPRAVSSTEQARNDQLSAYADELNAQHQGDPNWKPVTAQTMTSGQRVDAVRRAAGQLKQIEDAIRDANPNMTPAEVKRQAGQQILKNQAQANKMGNFRIEVMQNTLDTARNKVKDSAEIIKGIIRGDDVPTLAGLPRDQAAQVRAGLNREGYDIVNATKDWDAIKSHIHTMQGPIIQRQVQALKTVEGTIPSVREAYENWKATGLPSGFSDFNKAALVASSRLPGEAGVAAKELIRQVGDFTAEVGSVYMQGNANTDHSLDLAKQNLGAEWNEQSFDLALRNIEKFTQIRLNSIFHSGVVQGGQNRYDRAWKLNPTGQSGGAGAVGAQSQGESFDGRTLNGYHYTERMDLPPEVRSTFKKDGEQHAVTGPDGKPVMIKLFGQRFYQVDKAQAGK